MVRLALAVLLAAVLSPCGQYNQLAAQTAPHQRLGVSGDEILDITIGSALGLYRSDTDAGQGMEIDASLSIDLLYLQRFGLSIELPAVAWLALGRNVQPGAAAAPGDPSVAATCSFRLSDWRLGAELAYTHPAGIWEAHESASRRISSGSGYRRLGAAFTALRYLDPLVAGVRLETETCLARQERFGQADKPLIISLGFFATEALNATAALSASLTPRLAWPRRLEGKAGPADPSWSLSGSASFILSEGVRSFRFGVSKLLGDYTAPVALNIGYSFSIKK